MIRTLFIPLPMPGLNEILGASNAHWAKYAKMKKKWGGIVVLYARSQGFAPITGPAHYEFECLEPNRLRDPDNFCAGARKICLDGLREGGFLKNDGWEHVLSLSDTWKVDKLHPGVRLTVREA